jgi:hypothetical protein
MAEASRFLQAFEAYGRIISPVCGEIIEILWRFHGKRLSP